MLFCEVLTTISIGTVKRSFPKMVFRNRLSDRCNDFLNRICGTSSIIVSPVSSLLETFQDVTVVSMIVCLVMFNVCGGKPLLWQQTNPETTGLQGIMNPFLHYHT